MEKRAFEICALAYFFIVAIFFIALRDDYSNLNDIERDFKGARNSTLTVAGIAFGLFVLYKGFAWLKARRLIENVPTSKIRSLAMGLVEVYGDVIPAKGRMIRSPHSDRECVYYKYVIDEAYSIGTRLFPGWKKVEEGEDRTYFFIDDRTGFVLVDPRDAKIETSNRYGIFDESYSEKMGFLGMKKIVRYREHAILPRDKLYIMGTAAKNPFTKEMTATYNAANLIIGKGKNDRIFFISKNHERDIISQLKIISMMAFAASFIMVIESLTIALLIPV